MSLIKVNMNSDTLGMGIPLYVIVPQSGAPASRGGSTEAGPFKTLYLLHGEGGDYSEWLRNTSVERYVSDSRLAVVMPSGDNSWWSNLQNGMRYQDFIVQELVERCEQWFPLSSRPEDRFIGGISMGSYGALRAALRLPGAYSKVIGISCVTDIRPFYLQDSDRACMIFGEPSQAGENGADLFAAADRLAADSIRAPDFYLSTGLRDPLFPDSEKMYHKLHSLGFHVTLRPGEGTHDWQFGDSALGDALNWLFNEREGS